MLRHLLLFCTLEPLVVAGQDSDVQLSQRVEADTVILLAENTSERDLDLALTLKTRGFGRMPSEKITAFLPADSTVELIGLQVTPGKDQTISTEYRYTHRRSSAPKLKQRAELPPPPPESISQPVPAEKVRTNYEVPSEGEIIVYTQAGCPRCAATVRFLKSNRIKFTELDADKHNQQMFSLLRDAGFEGNQIQMPVVHVADGVFYNIKDLTGFLETLGER
jgi:glutaredoxin